MGVPNVFYSYWFVKSDHLGKVSVGLQSSAGDNAAILVDGSGSLVPANWVMFDNAGFFMRNKANGLLTSALWPTWPLQRRLRSRLATAWELRRTSSAMTAPTWAGFSMSADWGQDTYWDVYGRYSGEYNGIKIAAVTGWSETNRCKGNAPTNGSCPNSALVGLGTSVRLARRSAHSARSAQTANTRDR